MNRPPRHRRRLSASSIAYALLELAQEKGLIGTNGKIVIEVSRYGQEFAVQCWLEPTTGFRLGAAKRDAVETALFSLWRDVDAHAP
jgi:hypothetical protein